MKSKYITSLNALRGIAALSVVIFHIQSSKSVFHLGWDLFTKSYLAVDLFFILSGFVLMHAHAETFKQIHVKEYFSFIQNRLARIYPVHFATLMFMVTQEFLRYFIPSPELTAHPPFTGVKSLWALLTNLLLIQAWHIHPSWTWNIQAWSISSEWFVYLTAPLLIYCFKDWIKGWTPLLTYLLSTGALYALFSYFHTADLTYDFGNLRMLFEFCMGLSLYNIYRKFQSPGLESYTARFSIVFDIIFITASLALIPALLDQNLASWFIVQLNVLIILSAALSSGWVNKILSSRPLFYLGEISYSIYMVHTIILSLMAKLYFKVVHVSTPATAMGFVLVVVPIVLLIAHLTYRYIEIPARDFLREKWSGKRRIERVRQAVPES